MNAIPDKNITRGEELPAFVPARVAGVSEQLDLETGVQEPGGSVLWAALLRQRGRQDTDRDWGGLLDLLQAGGPSLEEGQQDLRY